MYRTEMCDDNGCLCHATSDFIKNTTYLTSLFPIVVFSVLLFHQPNPVIGWHDPGHDIFGEILK
jgi:hypothetical protein